MGWLCKPKLGAAIYDRSGSFDFRDDPDIQDRTYAHWLGTEMCEGDVPNRWEIEVPNGMYVVTAYFNKYVRNKGKAGEGELGRMLGCTFEGVRSPVWRGGNVHARTLWNSVCRPMKFERRPVSNS